MIQIDRRYLETTNNFAVLKQWEKEARKDQNSVGRDSRRRIRPGHERMQLFLV
jgi:hypothetical protein